jgi:hypothetical protein
MCGVPARTQRDRMRLLTTLVRSRPGRIPSRQCKLRGPTLILLLECREEIRIQHHRTWAAIRRRQDLRGTAIRIRRRAAVGAIATDRRRIQGEAVNVLVIENLDSGHWVAAFASPSV